MTPDKKSLFRAGFFDDRFRALVDYDPGDFELFGAAGVAAIDRPVLHFVAEKSGHTPHHPEADEYWTALHGREDLRLLLLGGDHNDFTDSCASGFTVRCSNIPPEEAWKPVRVYTLAFLEKMLGGAGGLDPLLHGEQSISTRIETTAR